MTKTKKTQELERLYQELVAMAEGGVEGGFLKAVAFSSWLKRALKVATGRAWSVKGSRGTAYGWINVSAPAARASQPFGYTGEEDLALLRAAFRVEAVHFQGRLIPSDRGFYWEAAQAIAGQPATIHGVRDWD